MGVLKKQAMEVSDIMDIPFSELLASKRGRSLVNKRLRRLCRSLRDIRYMGATILQEYERGVTTPKTGSIPVHYGSKTNKVTVYVD